MKKLVLALIMLVSITYSQAQTIGDHLNYIREQKPQGKFDSNTKPYTYTALEESVNSLMMYFLDDNLICYQLVIVPQDNVARQRWVTSLNDGWVVINSSVWKFYTDGGSILIATLDYVNNVGTIILIKEEKKEGVKN
jgi:hypothetical protein